MKKTFGATTIRAFLLVAFISMAFWLLAACGGNNEPAPGPSPSPSPTPYPNGPRPTPPGPTHTPQPTPPRVPVDGIHGLLTRITHGDNVAYIMGSMHMGRPGWFPLADVVEDAMARADVFAFEFDLAYAESEAVAMYMLSYAVLPVGWTLADVLTPLGLQNFRAFLASRNDSVLTEQQLEQQFATYSFLTPAFIHTMLTMQALEATDGIDTAYSVDWYVFEFALESGRPIVGLNCVFEEMRLLLDIPLAMQATWFDDLGDFDEFVARLTDMAIADAYEAQDMDAVLAALRADFPPENDRTPLEAHVFDTNFKVRCHIFAEEIARLLRETEEPTTFFVTIGLAHIIGYEFGQVIAMLEDAGFEAEPLWFLPDAE